MSQVGTSDQNSANLAQFRSLALIAAGSNAPLGEVDPAETIAKAVYTLSEKFGVIRTKSALYRTAAFPPGSGPDFVNAAFVLETDHAPTAVLAGLHAVEAAHGRIRRERWGARTLDLDLIAYGNQVLPDGQTVSRWMDLSLDEQQSLAPDRLILPHPRMHERAFVLVPLADVAPDWRHPVLDRSVAELLASLPESDLAEVKRL